MKSPDPRSTRIWVDANIPLAQAFLAEMGVEKVTLFEGRSLRREHLAEADALWVRSVTKVNAELLAGTPVRWVGTATAGVNHIDADWLDSVGIPWVSAPGSNSYSVADYVAAVLATFRQRGLVKDFPKVGVLGHGHVGSKVAARLRALGCEVRVYDPIRAELYPSEDLVPLAELWDCDVLTAHVPLTTQGPYATQAWLGREFLSSFRRGLVLINAARGEIMRQDEILDLRAEGFLAALALDVFENEPKVDPRALALADLVSPHVAGYSWTGKVRGTRMLAEALAADWDLGQVPPVGREDVVELAENEAWDLFTQVYPVESDDRRLREGVQLVGEIPWVFDMLRKQYPKRLEVGDHRVLAPFERQGFWRSLGFAE